ncbi:MAG: hypothetical protein IKV86_02290 [Clostridia bacterium]|nr:hypothetical protein [Clostridia bacterium]
MHNGLPVRFGKPTRRKSRFPIIMVIIIILALLAGIYFVHGIFFDKDTEEVTKPVETQQTEPVKEDEIVKPQDNTPATSATETKNNPNDESAENSDTEKEPDLNATTEEEIVTEDVVTEDIVTEKPDTEEVDNTTEENAENPPEDE